MVKITNKTNVILIVGMYVIQPGINYFSKSIYNGFWDNGLMNKIIKLREEGKIEVE